MAGKKILSDREHDLIAEITRLIAEGGEDMAALGLFRQETTSEGHDEVTAPQLAGNEGEAPHGTRWASSNIKVPRGVVLAIAVAGRAGRAYAGHCRSTGTEPSDAAGGRGSSRLSAQCRCVAARSPSGCSRRRS
jgi:hypothetical protein